MRKFNFHPKRVPTRFKPFKVVARTKQGLKALVTKSKKLEKAIKVIFSKKGLAVAATGTAVGVGVASIWNYIESNSGCFKRHADGSTCKYEQLSCCQKDKLDNVPFCDGADKMVNVCENFDADQEQSCCRLCDCQYVNCLPSETMQCQRPTVADALSHYASQFGSTLWSGIETIFPWLWYIIYFMAALFIFWIANLARSLLWRRK